MLALHDGDYHPFIKLVGITRFSYVVGMTGNNYNAHVTTNHRMSRAEVMTLWM